MNEFLTDRDCLVIEVPGNVCERMKKSEYVYLAVMNPEDTMTYVFVPIPDNITDKNVELFVNTAEKKLKVKGKSYRALPKGTNIVMCPPSNSSN
jgi:hypothetical protein